jgi:ankyrin repeat protein
MYNFNKIKKSLVFIIFISLNFFTHAGSYEDFFRAVQLDDVRTVESLLKRGFDPNSVSPEGVPALMLAVKETSLKVAELLVAWPKIKTEVRNESDESALMLSALKGHLPLVKLLIENNADVNKPGWTPLHYAATAGNVPIIELLLENSAYIDAESPNGSTPLMMAAMYGSPESVKVLIQAGADLNVKNQLGLTALDFAVRGNRQNSKELIETGLQREAARKARQQALDAPKAEAPKVDASKQ